MRYKVDFTGFEKRTEKLGELGRFYTFKPMYHRTSVEEHCQRMVPLLLEAEPIIKKVYPNFDTERAVYLILTHDDPEVYTGDIQSCNKRLMTPDQLKELEDNERSAIKKLVDEFPKHLGPYTYEELLLESFHKNTIEAKVGKYLDRVDAFGEGAHEVYAGNRVFAQENDSEGEMVPPPTPSEILRFNNHKENYPEITELIETNQGPFLAEYPSIDVEQIVENAKPHTFASFLEETELQTYNYWKKVMFNNLSIDQIKPLIKRMNRKFPNVNGSK